MSATVLGLHPWTHYVLGHPPYSRSLRAHTQRILTKTQNIEPPIKTHCLLSYKVTLLPRGGVFAGQVSPSRPRQRRQWPPCHKNRTYLVISKLQPFLSSRALFRMMPLSLPRYTFFSEFMGAGRAGRAGDTAAFSFPKKKSTNKNAAHCERWRKSREAG